MPKFKPLPSQEKLHDLFDYSVVTGELYWKNPTRYKSYKGRVAGSVNLKGYVMVDVKLNSERLRYYAHRVIWKWVTGEDPGALDIDHKNGIRDCNAWHNLRKATKKQNRANQPRRGWTKTPCGNYRVMCGSMDTNRYVGTFKTEAEARAAYAEAKRALHGEFSPIRLE